MIKNKNDTKRGTEQTRRIMKTKQDRKHILSANSGFFLQEAYKTLRTNVNFALANKEGCKVVMITSSLQGEGKSLTALNLAIALGQTDKKVLLIDCDLRRPKLARLLNLSASAGLSNLLMDFNLLNSALVSSEEYGIDLILAGDIPPNPAELLSSTRMQKFLSALREHYDYIIIDSPPVDLVVDPVVLSAQCDGVLFVVRAGQSERGAVIHAMKQLAYSKANVIGFAFNDVTAETTSGYGKYRYQKYGRYRRYSRYGRYGYHYGYGYGQQESHAEAYQGESKTDKQ
jgi:capsular exopolysaccharide synthesis family protein